MEALRITQVTISQNWSGKFAGQHVTVSAPYRVVIDAETEDSEVVWVVADLTHERRAFDRREGVVITPA